MNSGNKALVLALGQPNLPEAEDRGPLWLPEGHQQPLTYLLSGSEV